MLKTNINTGKNKQYNIIEQHDLQLKDTVYL